MKSQAVEILDRTVLNGTRPKAKVLGLFPYFGSEVVGGVQASARIA